MKTTIELPEELRTPIRELITREGAPLPEIIARLVKRRLRQIQRATPVSRDAGSSSADPELREWLAELL